MRGANSPWRDSAVRAKKTKGPRPKVVHDAPLVYGPERARARTIPELVMSYRPKLPPGKFNFDDPAGEALRTATLHVINQQFAGRLFKPVWEE